MAPIVTIILFIFSLTSPCMCQSITNVISLQPGKVRGVLVGVPAFNTSVYQYRRIPYAKPPVGDLRFKKPQQLVSWNDTLDGTEFGPVCVQNVGDQSLDISEDCLFLNIYVPQNTSALDRKPVMVYIHGGSYLIGSGQKQNGAYLAFFGDVIVVTINYRLGFLGFMSTQDDASRGNYGLWDQQMALVWVKRNIQMLGGNPNQITIFGESAGGFSVALQSLYPQNKGVFHQVIAQSGVANTVVATSLFPKMAAYAMGASMGCTRSKNYSSQELVHCLKSKTVQQILIAVRVSTIRDNRTHYVLNLAPVVDGDFLKDTPSNLLNNQTSPAFVFYRSLNFVVGNVDAEGSLLVESNLVRLQTVFDYNLTTGIPSRVMCGLIIRSIVQDWLRNNSDVSDSICREYSVAGGNAENIIQQSNKAVDMHSDFFFLVPAIETLNAHARGNTESSTYQFLVTRRAGSSYGGPYYPWLTRAGHASELIYLFGIQEISGIQQVDLELSTQMLTYWTNFARNGDPNVGQTPAVLWTPYTTETGSYINLGMETKMIPKRAQFWMDILKKSSDTTFVGSAVVTTGKPVVTAGSSDVSMWLSLYSMILAVMCIYFLEL